MVERIEGKVARAARPVGRSAMPRSISPANRPDHHTPIESADSIADIQQILAARRPSVPAGQFITTMDGWAPPQFT